MVNKEGIRRTDKGLEFDWRKLNPEDIIPLRPVHKQTSTQKDNGVKTFVAFAFYGIEEYARKNAKQLPPNKDDAEEVAKQLIDDARTDIKNLSSPEVVTGVNQMINIGLKEFEQINNIELSKFDLIISPTSSAPLNNHIMNIIRKKVAGGKTLVVSDVMMKKAIKDIKYMAELVAREKSIETKKQAPDLYQGLLKNPEELYAVKMVKASFRRYFTEFYKWSDGIDWLSLFKAATRGRVLLVDDTKGEGVTIKEMVRVMSDIGAWHIFAFILLLDYGAGYDSLKSPIA